MKNRESESAAPQAARINLRVVAVASKQRKWARYWIYFLDEVCTVKSYQRSNEREAGMPNPLVWKILRLFESPPCCVLMSQPSSRLELWPIFQHCHSHLCGDLHGIQSTRLPGPSCPTFCPFKRDAFPSPISTLQFANLLLRWPVGNQSSRCVLRLLEF